MFRRKVWKNVLGTASENLEGKRGLLLSSGSRGLLADGVFIRKMYLLMNVASYAIAIQMFLFIFTLG